MSKKLEELRHKIDALDNRIHDTLMERAALIVEVAQEKRKEGLQYVQPAREAVMIRRLLARHEGALPQGAVVRIWRELVGAVSLMQTGLKVAVSVESGGLALWEMAKDYFGSVVPMQKCKTPLAAISSVRDGESSFAVLPWPADGMDKPWWTFLFTQQDSDPMKIVCALPYGGTDTGQTAVAQDRGLVVSRIDFASSGEDHSFIVLQVDQRVSRARVLDVLSAMGLDVLGLNTARPDAKGYSLHLIEANDYFGDNDPRLAELKGQFEGHDARCAVIGGYPVPPVYKGIEIRPQAVKPEKKKTTARG